MNRRTFLATGVAATAAGLAGCRSFFETRSSRIPPVVDDRPDAVYVPTHAEGMQMVEMGDAGDYRVALSYSFPHRFWQVDVDAPNKVEIRDDDAVHLMATVWESETGVVVPNDGVEATVTRDGDVIDDGRMWAMLSQNMSIHAGDNFSLDGDGTYDVEVTVGPFPDRTTGAFADRFGDLERASFSMEFSEATLDGISFEEYPDRQGDRGAVDPMEMGMMPVARAPAVDDLPGTVLGEATSGDGDFVATHLDEPPAGLDAAEDDAYLAVSPRTPYNSYPLPFMGLSAAVTRGDESVLDDSLLGTLDPDLGYHYGAVVPSLESGDEVEVTVDTPPQISRHEGYETAFLAFSTMTFTA